MRGLTSVQQKVKDVASRFTECDYFYGNWTQVDEFLGHLDNVDRPTICHILPASGSLRPLYGASIFKDKPETIIAFLTPTELDFDGEENEDKVEVMKHLASLFIRALNDSGYFEIIDDEDIQYKVPYDTTDDNVTGIVITFYLQEVKGRQYCSLEEYEDLTFGYEPIS